MITSLQNPLVKHWVKLRKDGDYRHEMQTLLIEGKKQVAEANEIVALITTDPSIPNATLVSEEVFAKISGMKAPEGIAAEVKMPQAGLWTKLDRLLILDAISDPGNLGTLFRTALALGWDGIYLLPNCCDPFNDKALTSARGATLKIPFRQGGWEELEVILKDYNITAFVADLEGVSLNAFNPPANIGLVLGNEAHGPTKDTLKRCIALTIPIQSIESLNVAIAGGIMMYTLRPLL